MPTNYLVVGDAFIDRWVTTTSTRFSAEQANLPIYDGFSQREQHGGAANVARALTRLAPNFSVDDSLLARLDERPVKTRILCEGQQVCRYDMYDRCEPISPKRIAEAINPETVVVISDYRKGAIDEAQIEAIIGAGPSQIWANVKTIESCHWNLDLARSNNRTPATFWVCNEREYDADRAFYSCQPQVFVTKAEKGIKFCYHSENGFLKESGWTQEALTKSPVSVCGAGDVTFAALITVPEGHNQLIWAMAAAAEAVEHPFTYTPTFKETSERYLKYVGK